MSLRKALELLPDDRETRHAARDVVAFLWEHPDDAVTVQRISRATGLSVHRVTVVVAALAEAFVLDFGGSDEAGYVFVPTPILSLEVQRFLRTAPGGSSVQRGAQRFRDRYGTR